MSEINKFELIYEDLNVEDIIRQGEIQTCIEESNHQKPSGGKEGKIINFAEAKEKIEANKQK